MRAMIAVPAAATGLSIASNGIVTAQVNGETKQLGQLDVAMPKDPNSLIDDGAGHFVAPDANAIYSVQAGEEGGGTFVQGAIEESNVQMTNEMVNLLLLQRAYAASAQVVQAGDQLMSIANNLRR